MLMLSCRTCERQRISDRYFDLFARDMRPTTKLLMDSTALKILHDDGLPTCICGECYATLTAFQAFCARAIEADLNYRENCLVKCELMVDDTIKDDIPVIPTRTFSVSTSSTSESQSMPAVSDIRNESTWMKENDHQQHHSYGDDDERQGTDHDRTNEDKDENNESDCRKSEKTIQGHRSNRSDNVKNKCVSDSESLPNLSKSKQNKKGPRKRPYQPRPGARVADKSVRYTCDMCGKFFYEKFRLAGHLRQHCGLRPFPCDGCSKQYDKYSKLLVHQKTHLPPEPDEPTVCPHEGCGKSFRLPRYAQDHYERIHRGLRPKARVECICDQCGKSFHTRSNLLQHSKSHVDIEQYPYRCEVCGKRFLAKNGYTLHMLRHNDIRNFPCPLCPSRMVSQLELNYHVAKHNKGVQWPCQNCTMVFQQKSSLRRHELRVHRGYKPYVCSICNQEFVKQRSLINHERLHSSG